MCYNNDISVLVSINVINILTCEEKKLKKKIFNSSIENKFIKRINYHPVKLTGNVMNKKIIIKKQDELIKKKKSSQPSQIKTCGSTFKNHSGKKKAWQLIKSTGCDVFREGDAVISKKHCNFFVNNGNANSTDIEKLINKVRQVGKNRS